MNRKITLSVAMVAALVLLSGVRKTLADDFYQGKTIRFIVGYAPGGGYDTYTRAIARYMGKCDQEETPVSRSR